LLDFLAALVQSEFLVQPSDHLPGPCLREALGRNGMILLQPFQPGLHVAKLLLGFLTEPAVIQVPFLPLSAQYAERRALNFTDFVQSLAASGESRAYNPAAVGMEVHETHPVCLGGSPTDPANKVLVRPIEHAELCRFWNKVYRDARSRQQSSV